MTDSPMDDAMLMAFADGELDAETARAVAAAVAADPALQARVALFRATRREAKAVFGPMLDETVPALLRAAVDRMVEATRAEDAAAEAGRGSSPVISLDRARSNRPALGAGRARLWPVALAASLAAAVLAGAGGYLAGRGAAARSAHLDVAGLENPQLAEALEEVGSGKEVPVAATGQRFRVIASFRDQAQDLCREFEVDTADMSTVISVACHRDGEWAVDFALVAPAGKDGYAPASSLDALESYLSSIGAGPPLSAEEEMAALSGLRNG